MLAADRGLFYKEREKRIDQFIPEYIVSQLLLQRVAQEGKVDGIRYFSVRTPTTGHHLSHIPTVFSL